MNRKSLMIALLAGDPKKDSDWLKVTMNGKDKMTEADAQKMITDIVRKFAAK